MFDIDLVNDLMDQTQNWIPDLLCISLELSEIDIVDICTKGIDLDDSVLGNDVEISLHAGETALETEVIGGACAV